MDEYTGSKIGTAMKVRGEVTCSEGLVVAGELEGRFSGSDLTIEATGLVSGTVFGERIECAGRIEGNIVTRSLVLTRTACHVGTVETEDLVVQPGAILDCALQSGNRQAKEILQKTELVSLAPSVVLTDVVIAFDEDRRPCCMDVPWSERSLLLGNVVELLDKAKPLIKISGEKGSGKSLFVEKLLHGSLQGYEFLQVTNQQGSVSDLVREVARSLGVSGDEDLAITDLLARLRVAIAERRGAGRKVVLLVDDAQELYPATMEGVIRSLTNAYDDGEEMLQMVLLGTSEMEKNMVATTIEYFEDETNCQLGLDPLSIKDTAEYLRLCLQQAAVGGDIGAAVLLFPYETIKTIHVRSGGAIAEINHLASRAIRRACESNAQLVTPHFV